MKLEHEVGNIETCEVLGKGEGEGEGAEGVWRGRGR